MQDWRRYNLSPPLRGYRWVCQRGGHCSLVNIRTGVIRDTRWRDVRERYWRRRYSRRYTIEDDAFYRVCRNRPDPAGIIIGGLIGGLLGQALSGDDRAGATFAGITVGGVLGAALTRNMDCEDRSYAYVRTIVRLTVVEWARFIVGTIPATIVAASSVCSATITIPTDSTAPATHKWSGWIVVAKHAGMPDGV